MLSLTKYYLKNRLIPVAHRGASGSAPENTLAAYQKALDSGIPAIEVDVHLTKDNYIVAIHDDNLGRISNSNKLINESLYSELLDIEVGSWFDTKFSNEQIPTLEQVLMLIKGKAYLVLEMKPFSSRPIEFVQNVFNLLNNFEYFDKTIFVSFDYNLLKIIKDTNKRANIAAIKIPGSNLLPKDLKYMTNCDAVICSINELEDDFNNNSKLYKIPVGVYDVDSIELFNKAIEFQVQGIGTNYPDLIMKLLEEYL